MFGVATHFVAGVVASVEAVGVIHAGVVAAIVVAIGVDVCVFGIGGVVVCVVFVLVVRCVC